MDKQITKTSKDKSIFTRPKLDVLTLAAMLKKNYAQTEIARLYGVSPQAVSDYLKRHNDEIDALVQPDDYYALKWKQMQNNCLDSVSSKDLDHASLQQKVTCGAIAAEKSRLYSGQSTQNLVGIYALVSQIDKKERKAKQDIEVEIEK